MKSFNISKTSKSTLLMFCYVLICYKEFYWTLFSLEKNTVKIGPKQVELSQHNSLLILNFQKSTCQCLYKQFLNLLHQSLGPKSRNLMSKCFIYYMYIKSIRQCLVTLSLIAISLYLQTEYQYIVHCI